MEDLAGNANDLVEQEESTGSIPSPLFTGTTLNKRLRSKVWDDFIPTFADGKVTRAECMHCHRVFGGTNGTSSLIRHLTSCIPATQKRPKIQEHTSLACMQKGKIAYGSDPKQKKLSFLPSSQKKCTRTEGTAPVQKELALPDIPMDTNRKNQDVDQNGSHEEPAALLQKNVALPDISTDNNRKNLSNEEIMLPEQMGVPSDMSQKHQEVDQDASHEELIKMLAMHGHLPRMVEQDGFRKLVAWLNPTIKMSSHDNVMVNTSNLFQKEKSKLKEELIALCSRVCLSVYMWHYDPVLPFLCLRVHYIDDEWEKQQKIIVFRAVDSSCDANELSHIILGAVEQWGLVGKVFCIILDDAFIDDLVASNVKASLLERNPLTANQSLFVVRYATHLLDQVIQVGLDELDKIMEKLSKCSKHTKSLTPSAVQYPNCRYAPSSEDWCTARKICSILDDLHKHMDFTLRYPTSAHFFDMAWDVKKDVHFKSSIYKNDDTFSKIQEKMQKKFKECWKVCFFHFCVPMVMDPECRLKRIKSRIWLSDLDKNVRDYIHDVHDTLTSLFHEYSDQVEDPDNTSRSKTSMGTVVDGDALVEYYLYHQYQYSERPMTELDQYLQAPHLTTSEPVGLKRTADKPSALRWKEPSALIWWKEHSLNYPTVARMACDILALPSIADWKIATRTATLAISESGSKQWVEELVCTQDWLTPADFSRVFIARTLLIRLLPLPEIIEPGCKDPRPNYQIIPHPMHTQSQFQFQFQFQLRFFPMQAELCRLQDCETESRERSGGRPEQQHGTRAPGGLGSAGGSLELHWQPWTVSVRAGTAGSSPKWSDGA
ncbi:hypothetical protein BAE44_0003187 [Dichanthelium oligosanthes]|uniref:BED-type domain-containing protein n=1 Tax=Dichanthelium oligosanthes TaxID=888268 RepID=A0A1E5WEI2_9POAL|nr:hypothetical protein BAE44_0003187 [Dichanthelium oligosanthes]